MTRPVAWIAVALLAALFVTAASPVEARFRPPANGPLLLVGEIHVGGEHSGVLELRLDGKPHASIPVGTGIFEIAMPRDGHAGMVSLEFTAPGLRLRSLVGGQQRLARRAGAGGRLTVDDEDGLRVSPLGTAMAVVASGPDGLPPRSDVALADAVQAASPGDIVQASAAIERLALEPTRLPKGFPDGLALVEDPAAFNMAIQADPGLVSDPQLVLDPLPFTPLGAGDVGDVVIFAGPLAAPGTPITGPGLVIEREAGGFRLHDQQFDGPPYLGGISATGVLELVPASPVAQFAGYRHCASLGHDTMFVVHTVQQDVRRHWRGADASLWQLGTDSLLRSPECPEFKPVALRSVRLSAAPDMMRTRLLTTPRRVLGRHSLPVFCGSPLPHGGIALDPCGQADHVFARDGSGVAYPVGEAPMAFGWEHDAHGAIRVDYGDASTRFWIIDPGDRTIQAVAYVAAAVVVGYPGTSSGHATLVRGGLPD
ncbi:MULTISPECIES: hypothetical protein [unclassified Luteimonas]